MGFYKLLATSKVFDHIENLIKAMDTLLRGEKINILMNHGEICCFAYIIFIHTSGKSRWTFLGDDILPPLIVLGTWGVG